MKRLLAENIQEVEFTRQIEGVRVGRIISIDEGQPVVDFTGNTHGPVAARFAGSIKPEVLQKAASEQAAVLIAFENNDPAQPIIIDTLCASVNEAGETSEVELETGEIPDVTIDGRRVTFDAKEEIVLRCGKASITLTRSGKVLIRGAYLLNRSSGVNRIKGGSVQIN